MITTANAMEMQRLGNEAKRAKKQKIALTLSVIGQSNWEDQERLRLREAIASLHRDLENATEGKEKLYITSAIAKLVQPAGLPNAGSFRPIENKKSRPAPSEPLD